MTIIQERPPAYAGNPHVHRAWIAVALVPVALFVAIGVSFVGEGAGPGVGGTLVGLLALAAPAAAVVLSSAAMRSHERSAGTVLAVSIVAFVAVAVLLPIVAISVVAWLIAMAVAVGAVGYLSCRPAR